MVAWLEPQGQLTLVEVEVEDLALVDLVLEVLVVVA